MVATKALLIAASALGAMAAPALPPTRISPGIGLPNGSEQKEASNLSVRAVPNPKFKPNGRRALQKVYAKYHAEAPAYLREIFRRDGGSGSVTANPGESDLEYTCPVDINGQQFNLDFDTGSADLWVYGSDMPSDQQGDHHIYKTSKAKKISGSSWSISYGDGSSASGDVYSDTVTIGGVVVKNQGVEAATDVSDSFTQDSTNDGLVGLAFGSINTVTPKQQKTFFENAMSTLDNAVMTADLKHEQPGSYDFGTIDKTKYTGEIQYVPIKNSQGFWQFGSGSSSAIADTGTTLLLISSSQVKTYYKQVKGAKLDNSQGGYTFPCSAHLPDLEVPVGSGKATISGKFLNYAPITEGSTTCFGGVQSASGLPFSIYGDIFFKQFFSVFDYKNKRFGFANKPSDDGN
ncbi:Aspergillopepsin-F [Orbilia brochopaga]|nr:Aspergillopepsin-F [Drechslerella brochopaga]